MQGTPICLWFAVHYFLYLYCNLQIHANVTFPQSDIPGPLATKLEALLTGVTDMPEEEEVSRGECSDKAEINKQMSL